MRGAQAAEGPKGGGRGAAAGSRHARPASARRRLCPPRRRGHDGGLPAGGKPHKRNPARSTAAHRARRWAAVGAAGAALGVSCAVAAGAGGGGSGNGGAGGSAGPSCSTGAGAAPGSAGGSDAISALRAENAALRMRLAALAEATLPAELLGGDDADAGAAATLADTCADDPPSGSSSDSDSGTGTGSGERGGARGAARGVVVGGKQRRGGVARVDAAYFESYSYFDIHREMLGDAVRTARRAARRTGSAGRSGSRPAANQLYSDVRGPRSACAALAPPNARAHALRHPPLPPAPRRSRAPRRTGTRSRPTPGCCGARACWTSAAAPASCPCLRRAGARRRSSAWTRANASRALRGRWAGANARAVTGSSQLAMRRRQLPQSDTLSPATGRHTHCRAMP